MIKTESHVDRAIALMRAAQAELDRGGHAAVAAHLETALGFAEAESERQRAPEESLRTA